MTIQWHGSRMDSHGLQFDPDTEGEVVWHTLIWVSNSDATTDASDRGTDMGEIVMRVV